MDARQNGDLFDDATGFAHFLDAPVVPGDGADQGGGPSQPLANTPPGTITPSTTYPWLWGNPFGNFSFTGSIGSSSEVDYYRFIPDQSGSYVFTTTGGLDAQFRVYNSGGNPVTNVIDSAGAGGTETTSVSLTTGQWYYVAVTGFQTSTGSYTLSVDGPSFPTTTISTPATTYTGSFTSGDLYAGDLDYFSVTAPSGTNTLSISVDPSSGLNTYVEVYNSSGTLLTTINSSLSNGGVDSGSLSVTAGQTYYIGVSGQQSTQTGTFTIDVDFNPDQAVNTGDPPGSITPGTTPAWIWGNPFGNVSTSASISSGTEVDYYRFLPDQSGNYVISLNGSLNGQLRIYDSTGAALTGIIDSSGANGTETTTVNVTTGQWVYVAVAGSGTNTGSYTLNVDGPNFPITASLSTPGPNYTGSYSSGDLYAGDLDYFAVTAPTGTNSLSISVDPSSGLNTYVEVYNSSGTLLTTINSSLSNGGVDSGSLSVTPGQTYYIGVSGQQSTQTGTFTLSVDFNPDQSVTNVPPTVTILAGATYAAGTVLTGSQLFSASDPQGTSDIDYIKLFDASVTGGGVWRYSGAVINPGAAAGGGFQFEYANRDLLTYTVGTGSNDFTFEAFDNSGADSNDATHTITGVVSGGDDTISSATDISAALISNHTYSINDSVGGGDPADYFHFTAPTGGGTLTVDLSGLSSDVDIKIVDSAGNVIGGAISVHAGTAAEHVSLHLSANQSIYVDVYPYQVAQSPYALNAQFTPDAPVSLPTAADLFDGHIVSTMSNFALLSYAQLTQGNTDERIPVGDPGWTAAFTGLYQGGDGWRFLSATNFNLVSSTVSYFTNGNAAAFVARSADALVVVFRGTDDGADVGDWTAMDDHYALFASFITALNAFVNDAANHISTVYVVGHSLGAALVDRFMQDHPASGSGPNYRGFVFAHPDFNTAHLFDNAGVDNMSVEDARNTLIHNFAIDLYDDIGVTGVVGAAADAYTYWLRAHNGAAPPTSDARITSFHNANDIILNFDFSDRGVTPGRENVFRYSSDTTLTGNGHARALYDAAVDYLMANGVRDSDFTSNQTDSAKNTFVLPAPGAGGGADVLSDNFTNCILVGGAGSDTYKVNAGLGIVTDLIIDASGQDDTLQITSAVGVAVASIAATSGGGSSDLRLWLEDANGSPIGVVVIRGQLSGDANWVVEHITLNGVQLDDLPTSVSALAAWNSQSFRQVSLFDIVSVTNPDGSVTSTIDAHGGPGSADTVSFDLLKDPITANLQTGLASVMVAQASPSSGAAHAIGADGPLSIVVNIAGMENVIGTSGADQITGNAIDNNIEAGAGDDVVSGGDGNDTLIDGGDEGNDVYAGDTGTDTVVYAGSSADLLINLATSGVNAVGAGADTLTSVENIISGAGDDRIIGGAGVNALYGGGGDDHIYSYLEDFLASTVVDDGANVLDGGSGNDTLRGSGGAETLLGGDGDDSLGGRGGADLLDGGAGVDMGVITRINQSANYTFDFSTGVGGDITDPSGAHFVSIERLQYSGGSGVDTVTGGSMDDLLQGGDGNDALAGLAGVDRLDGQGGDDILNGGDGADFLFGGDGDNPTAPDGNDTLNGGAGADAMFGGVGNDTYYVDDLNDYIEENANEGVDVALVSVSGYTLADNVEVGAVQGGGGLSLTGNSSNNILYGAAGGDTLNGGNGDDTLQGGAGADTMNGGLGNDTFYVAQVGDTVVENIGEGADATIVQMTSAYTLAANVEIGATFLSSSVNITGNGLDNLLYGGAGADTLSGAGGNDTIQGNAGADTMAGGLGNDTYFFEDTGDVITENSGEGVDAVIVFTSSYTLAANVEVGARFLTTAYTLTGNALDNQLYGNNGADTLNGGGGNDTIQGGGGNDTMAGGIGNDTYFVEQAGDVVTENVGEGSDAVIVLIGSYTLAANVEVGATFLTSGASITGNGLDNRLYGNIGADTLNGGAGADLLDGGAGADTLTGGSENDTFTFVAGQAGGDTVTDFSGNGASAGDVMRFAGYGTAAGGATFVQLDATHWQINSADGTIHDTITLANGASVDASDWLFV